MIVDYQCRSSSNARFLIHYYFVHHLLTYLSAVSRYLFRISTVAKRSFQNITDRTRCTGLTRREEQNMIKVIHTPLINTRRSSMQSLSQNTFFFFKIRGNLTFLKSVFYGSRWGSKILVVPGFYKRCTLWFELETGCADLKPFTITLRL